MRIFGTFGEVVSRLDEEFRLRSYPVKAPHWQGVDVSTKPEMAMQEILNWSFQVPLRFEVLDHWRADIKPNLPWADEHFAERVGGEPLNPGESWKRWPWGNSADKFRNSEGEFDHTYMERIWPKYAGYGQGGKLDNLGIAPHEEDGIVGFPHKGIRFEYGDLNDVIQHLKCDPLSRQAYLPIWFPEDGTCAGRRPCSLGYHFILRHGFFHHTYYIRSCDFVRHFADDCYLAVRLHGWVLDRLRDLDPGWKGVKLGLFTMHIVSLHMFRGDYENKYGHRNNP